MFVTKLPVGLIDQHVFCYTTKDKDEFKDALLVPRKLSFTIHLDEHGNKCL